MAIGHGVIDQGGIRFQAGGKPIDPAQSNRGEHIALGTVFSEAIDHLPEAIEDGGNRWLIPVIDDALATAQRGQTHRCFAAVILAVDSCAFFQQDFYCL